MLFKYFSFAEVEFAFLIDVVFSSQAHQWVLDNMDNWVEKYLIADNSLRIRNGTSL